MVYTCQYCNNVFSRRPNLVKHQHSAKYCLKLQGIELKNCEYTCSKCGNVYMHIDSYNRHKKQCSTGYDQILLAVAELQSKHIDSMTELLLDKIKDIVAVNSTGNTRNMVLNNLSPITDEQLLECVNQLSLDFIEEGAKGYADFANFYPLKGNIICTDKSRKRIRYKDKHGDLTDDSRDLGIRFFSAIKIQNEQLINAAYQDIHSEIKRVIADNKEDVDISELLIRASNLQEMLIKCRSAANGQDDDFIREFVRHLTDKL